MVDNNNTDETDDDITVVSPPDSLAAADSDPGKAINEDGNITTIENVGIKNTVYIAHLDGIKAKAREIAEEIQDELRKYEDSEDSQIYIAGDPVATQVIELHVLTLTYFEGVAFRFLTWVMKVGDDLEKDIQEETRYSVDQWEDSDIENLDITTRNYINAFTSSGVLEDAESLHNVKRRRNVFVHNPDRTMGLRTNQETYPGKRLFEEVGRPEKLREENLNDSLIEVLTDCLEALDNIENMIDNHLPIDKDLYNSIVEKPNR
jgi:hypothetical protein